jgi:PAS domain S-box-containing protein
VILLVSADAETTEKVQTALASPGSASFSVVRVRQLDEGLNHLRQTGVDAILLDLTLPDSQGIETFDRLYAASSETPILIVGGSVDETLAVKAVERGAQDYILPGHLDSYSLPRAVRNAIERKVLEDVVYAEKERAQVTLNSIGDAVLCTDEFGNVTYLNPVAERLTGWEHQEALGQPLATVFRIVDGVTREVVEDPLKIAVEHDETVALAPNSVLISRDGSEYGIDDSSAPIHDRGGRTTGAVIVFRDVSASRSMSRKMRHAAQHDALTHLPNRLLLEDRISKAIELARREERSLALMFLDLDHFKYINDSLGHRLGDCLLQSVATRLISSLRKSDTVSRQGGDEFVILLPEISFPEDAARSATKILLSLGEPHRIGCHEPVADNDSADAAHPGEASELVRKRLLSDGEPHPLGWQSLHVTASIGIAVYPGDGEDSQTLIQNADVAMYKAKETGRNLFQFYKPEMNSHAIERQSLDILLRRALVNEEFLLHYQPKVNLTTGQIVGVEALIRWQQPDQPLKMPGQFVEIAEECGLIVPIGRWVLREACMQVRAWQRAGLPPLPVAVNVSAIEFCDGRFLEGVQTILEETGLETQYLELELTEGILMKNVPSTLSALDELKKMGVHMAMDDFGTGYSSLSYLRQYPIEIIKIDRSFISEITAETNHSALVSAIIKMGRGLNCLVVAEGIETLEQKSYLQAHECPHGQGYFFSRPVNAQQFGKLLQTGGSLPFDA